ncbi:MAG: hypothetical protein R3Y24_01795 [Eubacteriales bacterium]
MNEENYWNTFLNTGKVEDYLKSKSSYSQKSEGVGDKPNAGAGDNNRNDIKDSTYRGI